MVKALWTKKLVGFQWVTDIFSIAKLPRVLGRAVH